MGNATCKKKSLRRMRPTLQVLLSAAARLAMPPPRSLPHPRLRRAAQHASLSLLLHASGGAVHINSLHLTQRSRPASHCCLRCLSRQERFTRTFDVFPFEQPRHPQTATAAFHQADTKQLSSSTTGGVYGFGSASLRFQNEVYGCHLNYGKVNKAVLELAASEPVEVRELAPMAPSRLLPEFAAKFKPELGRTFATTVSRDAPPGKDGLARYWVQPKDTGGLFPGTDEPELFSMDAPRGAGPPTQMHAAPSQLLTPAERREVLVFDKCHQRARAALRKAANDACQVTRVMQQRYPNGVIGLEGPGCEGSVIYSSGRQTRLRTKAGLEAQREQRFESIKARRDTQLDYKLLTHDHANTAVDHLFPRKAKSSIGVRGAPSATCGAARPRSGPASGSSRLPLAVPCLANSAHPACFDIETPDTQGTDREFRDAARRRAARQWLPLEPGEAAPRAQRRACGRVAQRGHARQGLRYHFGRDAGGAAVGDRPVAVLA